MKRATQRAHEAVRAVVEAGEVVIDATVGNGNDTIFLARWVGAGGTVYGFDVQAEAVEATRQRLLEADAGEAEVRLIHGGHESMTAHVRGPVAAVMFNLGYLPGGNHALTTRVDSTLAALEQAKALLRPGGVISVVCYRGHEGAAEEAEAVCHWARRFAGEEAEAEVEICGREESGAGPFLVVVRKGGPN